jgi:Tfp pilus assembly protein PilF
LLTPALCAAEILPRVRTANKRSVTIFPSDLAASIYRPAGEAAHNATRQRLSFGAVLVNQGTLDEALASFRLSLAIADPLAGQPLEDSEA